MSCTALLYRLLGYQKSTINTENLRVARLFNAEYDIQDEPNKIAVLTYAATLGYSHEWCVSFYNDTLNAWSDEILNVARDTGHCAACTYMKTIRPYDIDKIHAKVLKDNAQKGAHEFIEQMNMKEYDQIKRVLNGKHIEDPDNKKIHAQLEQILWTTGNYPFNYANLMEILEEFGNGEICRPSSSQ